MSKDKKSVETLFAPLEGRGQTQSLPQPFIGGGYLKLSVIRLFMTGAAFACHSKRFTASSYVIPLVYYSGRRTV